MDDQEQIVQSEVGEQETTGESGEVSSGDVTQGKSEYEALLKEVEGIRKANRAFQREKDIADKRAKEAERRATELEKMVEGIRGRFGEDTEFKSTVDELELRTYKDRDTAQKEYERRMQEFNDEVKDVADEVKTYGVDPMDPAFKEVAQSVRRNPDGWIDLKDMRRKMVAKARELSKKETTVSDDVIEQITQKILAQLRKDQGLDTSDNIPPAGEASTDIKKLVQRYSEGDELNKADEKKVQEYLANLK